MKALALGLALAGCATVEPAPAPVPPQGACETSGLSGLLGQPATAELGGEAMRLSGATRLRWIRPGDMVTMDYSPQRLNIHLDAQNRVDHFACG